MTKIKLGITGYTGRMGQAILSEVQGFPEFSMFAALVGDNKSKEQGAVKLTDSLDELCDLSDVVIDFSVPETVKTLTVAAVKHKVPLVSGTTSLSESDFKALEQASKEIPVLYSQNMSIGISALGPLLREMYLKLENRADVEIIETHHKNKKDAPSGTALLLASQMLNKRNLEPKLIEKNLFEVSADHSTKKISIVSIREKKVPGIHNILFNMKNETIKISHQAHSRNIFAIGALTAAAWLYKQRVGLHSMQNIT